MTLLFWLNTKFPYKKDGIDHKKEQTADRITMSFGLFALSYSAKAPGLFVDSFLAKGGIHYDRNPGPSAVKKMKQD